MKAKAVIVKEKDGTYSIYSEDIEYGLVGEGKTEQEAIENWKTSYEDMKKLYKKKGKEFVEVEFEFKREKEETW